MIISLCALTESHLKWDGSDVLTLRFIRDQSSRPFLMQDLIGRHYTLAMLKLGAFCIDDVEVSFEEDVSSLLLIGDLYDSRESLDGTSFYYNSQMIEGDQDLVGVPDSIVRG